MSTLRRTIIAGNWKMNKTRDEARDLINAIVEELGTHKPNGCEIILCPPFTAIADAVEILGNHSSIMVGAQNLHEKASGAYTGEISASMLRDLYCRYVIIGHSERRQYFAETDELVNAKAQAAFGSRIDPIICVGETLEQRESGKTNDVVCKQVEGSLAGFTDEQWADTVIAYEPVWAIGTGKVATPEQAQEVHAVIRGQIAKMAGDSVAEKLPILYGGSVKPDNSAEIISQPDVDGALVGGASLEARSFVGIIKNAAKS